MWCLLSHSPSAKRGVHLWPSWHFWTELNRKPDTRGIRLSTAKMTIIGQSVHQVAIAFTLHFLGRMIQLALDHLDEGDQILVTLVFSMFVSAQIFDLLNRRRLNNKLNIFENIAKNTYFIVSKFLASSLKSVYFDTDDCFQRLPMRSSLYRSVVRIMKIPVPGHPLV
jgi:hypothetical protein